MQATVRQGTSLRPPLEEDLRTSRQTRLLSCSLGAFFVTSGHSRPQGQNKRSAWVFYSTLKAKNVMIHERLHLCDTVSNHSDGSRRQIGPKCADSMQGKVKKGIRYFGEESSEKPTLIYIWFNNAKCPT